MRRKSSIISKIVSGMLAAALLLQPMGMTLAETPAAPAAEEEPEIYFQDDFETGKIGEDWVQYCETGEYTVEQENDGNHVLRLKGIPWDAKLYTHVDDETWTDYAVEMEFTIQEWLDPDSAMGAYDCVGLVGRRQAAQQIAVYYRRDSETLQLNKMYGNEGHVLASEDYKLEPGIAYKMRLEFIGNVVSAYIAEKEEEFGRAVLACEDAGNSGPAVAYGGAGVESGGCDFTVDNFRVMESPKVVAVEEITLDKSSLLLEKDEKAVLTAEVLPVTASDRTVTWSSSNTDVAEVDENGAVTAIGAGDAVITAASAQNPEIKAECTVEIYEALPCSTFYYVAPYGSDESGDGSEEKPFATIQKARDTIRALNGNIPDGGITVYLREGDYYQEETIEFLPEDSGKPGSPIVYTSYPGEQAVITGGKTIDGWKPAGEDIPYMADEAKGNLFVADIETGWRFHDLYVDGERQQISQQMETKQFRTWPQFSGTIGEPDAKILEVNPEKGIKVRFNEGELDGLEGNPDIEINCMTVMFWNALPVLTDVNEEENTAYLYSYNPCNFGPKDRFNHNEGGWYSILNDIKYLDTPGEWCVDTRAGKVYYWPKEENFTEKKIVAPVPYELVRFQGDEEDQDWEEQVEYIVLDNLIMEYTDRLPESQFDQYNEIRNVENPDGAIFMQGAANCRITNSIVRHTGSYGITLSHYAQKNEILHNELGDLGSGGVNFLGYGGGTTDLNKDNRVMYNNIHDLGCAPYLHTAGVTIFQSGGNTISYNYISNSPYAGVTILGIELASFNSNYIGEAWDFFGKTGRQFAFRWDELELGKDYTREESKQFLHSRNNVVEYNILDEYMNGLEDGGGLYAWGCGYDNAYRNNIIIKTEPGMHWTFPLYMDDEVDRMTVSGNRIWSMEQGTTNKGENIWSDNQFSWPEKPEGYDELWNRIMETVEQENGGFIADEVEKPVLLEPEKDEENADLPAVFSWETGENANKYLIEVSKDKDFSDILFYQLTSDTTVSVEDLEYGETYYWRVTAYGWADQSVSDVSVFRVKEQGMPSVPRNLKISSDYGCVLLQWSESLHTSYNIYRKTAADAEFTKIASEVTGGSCLDDAVEAGTLYEYYVTGVTPKGESAASEQVSVRAGYTKILFEEDFEDGVSSEWTEKNNKEMSVSDGVCHLDGEEYGFFVHLGDESWVDYAVELDVNLKGLAADVQDWTGFGPITRAVTTGDFNQFVTRSVTGIQEAIKCYDSRYWAYFASGEAFDFTMNEWHKMRVEHKDGLMRCYIDQQLIFELEDTGFQPYGGAGFNFIYEIADVDNFRVIAEESGEAPAEAEKWHLQKAYDYGKNLSTDNVVDTARKIFENAMAQAKAVLDDPEASQEQVNAAFDELVNAIHGLGIVKGDKTYLKLLIDKADSMLPDEEKYVAENWPALVSELAEGKEVYDDGDALQEDVDTASEELLNAILIQRLKANKSNLEELVNKAESMDLGIYTKESVTVLRQALARSKAILADESLSVDEQNQVDQAEKELNDAIENLVKVLADDSNGDSQDNTGDSQANNGNNGNGGNSGGSGNNGGSVKDDGTTPKTGDDFNAALWIGVLLAAFSMAAVLVGTGKRNRK